MPEGVGYGPQYTASVGPGLNYVGNRVYSYGGVVAVANSLTAILGPFTTGNGSIVSELQITDSSSSNDDKIYYIKFNDVSVQVFVSKNASDAPGYPAVLVIPPFTKVEVIAYNLGSSTERNQTACLTGRVYK